MTAIIRIGTVFLIIAPVLTACKPTASDAMKKAEEKRIECLDKICDGDVQPTFDHTKERITKINGQWFVGPKEYGIYNGTLAFFWPSKTPANMEHGETHAPEFKSSTANKISNFYSVAIEIFLRSNNTPPEPTGFKLIELAQNNDWIASRKNLRPGLDVIQMKHVIGPHAQHIDHASYYIATQLKGQDGLPPVATCSQDIEKSDRSGGTGFMWQPGIWAGTRMHEKHCADWPEIYIEIENVLKKLRKV